MKWFRRKRKGPTPEQREALKARVRADLQMREAEANHREAESLAGRMRQVRSTNHFSESLEWTFGGGRP